MIQVSSMPAGKKMPPAEMIRSFASAAAFRDWLAAHHDRVDAIWLRLSRKAAREPSLRYPEALDEALCHGWIDGQVRSFDAESYFQWFGRRRPKSGWSRINTGHVERLTTAGQMHPAGLAAVEAARTDGRWAAAYASPRHAQPPADFLAALAKDPPAEAFFKTLNRLNTYAIFYRLETARTPATRERRMRALLAKLHRGERLHPPPKPGPGPAGEKPAPGGSPTRSRKPVAATRNRPPTGK